MDFLDEDLLCPISMEIMEDPVTICTGVTYERKNIQKWFKKYKKNTCPATMQCIDHNFEMTPNHTLKRLIQAWKNGKSQATTSTILLQSKSNKHDDLVSILESIESTPFKVSSLKKLRCLIEVGDDKKKMDLVKLGGVEVLVKIIVQILVESSDFAAFRACEEALVVLHQLFLVCVDDDDHHQSLKTLLVNKPECMKSCALMLQRGSAQARFCAVSLLQKMVKDSSSSSTSIIEDEGIGFFKSLLEIVSDELYTKSSSCALQVLIDILNVSKKSRLKTIEAGGVCILIELLPDSSSKSKCERIMELIKMICECDEGRVAFQEHGLGIAAISKKILNVSNTCTKIGVKILWLISSSCNSCHQPAAAARESVLLEEMLSFGGVSKLVTILHFSGQSSTKDRALKVLKLHANYWKTNPCFPKEIDECYGWGIN